MNCEEVCSGGIAACHHKVCADVTLVAEEMLFEHGHDSDDAWFAAGGEGVEFEVGGHECGGEFGVCGGTGTSTPDLRCDVVKLLAVLYILSVGVSAISLTRVCVPCLQLWDRWWREYRQQ